MHHLIPAPVVPLRLDKSSTALPSPSKAVYPLETVFMNFLGYRLCFDLKAGLHSGLACALINKKP